MGHGKRLTWQKSHCFRRQNKETVKRSHLLQRSKESKLEWCLSLSEKLKSCFFDLNSVSSLKFFILMLLNVSLILILEKCVAGTCYPFWNSFVCAFMVMSLCGVPLCWKNWERPQKRVWKNRREDFPLLLSLMKCFLFLFNYSSRFHWRSPSGTRLDLHPDLFVIYPLYL